jgi:hypothetical protein
MTETQGGLSARTQRLAAMLAGWPRRRVGIADLWRLLDETDPTTPTDVRRRRIMAALIAELHGAGLIELPAARSYDHSETPGLPRFVTLPQPATEGRQLKPVVWHPALSWVPEARITRWQAESLERVNHWLHNSRDPLVVPARERSLELFGDEKAIDHLVGTSIFGPGRLTMELLRCRRVSPPLHCEPCGSGDLLVVIENQLAGRAVPAGCMTAVTVLWRSRGSGHWTVFGDEKAAPIPQRGTGILLAGCGGVLIWPHVHDGRRPGRAGAASVAREGLLACRSCSWLEACCVLQVGVGES